MVMDAFFWYRGVLTCVMGALGGIGMCLKCGVGEFRGDGIVLNDILGALIGLGGFWKVVMEAFL